MFLRFIAEDNKAIFPPKANYLQYFLNVLFALKLIIWLCIIKQVKSSTVTFISVFFFVNDSQWKEPQQQHQPRRV